METVERTAVPWKSTDEHKKKIEELRDSELKKPDGARTSHQLAAKADVVLHNMRDAAAAKLGVDEASLRTVNPRLLYCSISG